MKYLLLLSPFLPLFAASQVSPAEQAIRSGNAYYKAQQFAKAEEEFSKAAAKEPGNTTARFNRANALFKQDKQVEAAMLFTALTGEATDPAMRAKAYFNKGVVLSRQHATEESIEAYKNALRLDPDDTEARENLQKALLELKKKKNSPEKKENKKQQQKEEPKKQSPSRMNPKEAEQRLRLLQQKEKEVQQRVQKDKTKSGGSQPKDW